ncbi:MAG TPA: phage tail protein [Ilumatobacteraceae bacterium]|nr:phage tail protein [Ilumatobacteraceae bacterium]
MTTIVPGDDTSTSIVSSLFAVEFAQVASGEFTDVSGLNIDIEEVQSTYRTADGKSITRFSAGTVKYSTITLKREFNGNREFWDWHDKMCKGEKLYTDGSIVLHDLAGTEVDRWNVLKAWPSKWSVSDLDAGSDDVLVEEIELQIEGLERT